jgi:hypothetical protein
LCQVAPGFGSSARRHIKQGGVQLYFAEALICSFGVCSNLFNLMGGGGDTPMTMTQRVLLAAAIVLVDLVAFFLPLTALMLAYVIVFNPPWFRDFVKHLEKPG